MYKIKAENTRLDGRLRLSSQRPVRVSKEELAASRAGTLGCFPSADLYEPEDVPAEKQLAPLKAKRHSVMRANSGN